MNRLILLSICFAMLVIPSYAQNCAACSPVGVWYGGSDVKYLLTVTAASGDKFVMRAEPVFDVADLGGYKALTTWSGEFRKISRSSYLGQYISLYTTSSEVPPPPGRWKWTAYVVC